ncbi:MAG: SpoIID/LytB domain-containing protein [Calditrichaeota bacterium]|nr:SpoIID/LytB domain-containing protein [Calditrichota bacterium]
MAKPKPRFVAADTTIAPRRAEKAYRRDLRGPDPIVRVGIMEEYDRIEFSVDGPFDLIGKGGVVIASAVSSQSRWMVLPDETDEARVAFSILTTAFADRDSADSLRDRLITEGHPARVAEIGDQVYIDGRLIADNVKYRVLVGRWPTEKEAKGGLEPFREEFAPRVIRQVVRPATGSLDIVEEADSSGRRFKASDGFRIATAGEATQVTLYDVREGTGFHWEREVDRKYPGVIEIAVDHRALLMAYTELPLELYLKGVVPSEMPASYPLDALKAQSIAARSEVLAKMGAKHPNDPFDLCAHVHCQAYTGSTNDDKRAAKAVEETRGMVLMLNHAVAEAVYSSTCGGHSEDKVNVWNPPDAPHLKGRWDADQPVAGLEGIDLSSERQIARWVEAKPKVWCNTAAFGDLPTILQKASDNFRWEVTYTRRELEDIIKRKSGEDIGQLIDVVPIRRGISGRLMEIEIQGTKKNLRIQRELNIRATLSLRYLKSACFAIIVEYGEDGRPINFHLKGAGWGHGVGMCQVGAGVMASQGKKFKDILTHYYPGTKVDKVY